MFAGRSLVPSVPCRNTALGCVFLPLRAWLRTSSLNPAEGLKDRQQQKAPAWSHAGASAEGRGGQMPENLMLGSAASRARDPGPILQEILLAVFNLVQQLVNANC